MRRIVTITVFICAAVASPKVYANSDITACYKTFTEAEDLHISRKADEADQVRRSQSVKEWAQTASIIEITEIWGEPMKGDSVMRWSIPLEVAHPVRSDLFIEDGQTCFIFGNSFYELLIEEKVDAVLGNTRTLSTIAQIGRSGNRYQNNSKEEK